MVIPKILELSFRLTHQHSSWEYTKGVIKHNAEKTFALLYELQKYLQYQEYENIQVFENRLVDEENMLHLHYGIIGNFVLKK